MLQKILNPLTNLAPQKLKNTNDVRTRLQDVVVADTDILVSFDVKSLFTQISPDLALENISELLDSDNSWYNTTALNKDDIIELAQICLSSTVFQYNNKIYQQIHGTPMGSSASGPFAEIVMQAIEKTIFESSPCPLKLWCRYVDDVLAIIPRDQLDSFSSFINSVNRDIQFQTEVESDGTCLS